MNYLRFLVCGENNIAQGYLNADTTATKKGGYKTRLFCKLDYLNFKFAELIPTKPT